MKCRFFVQFSAHFRRSRSRSWRRNGWDVTTEDTVEKRTFLSEGYAERTSGRERLDRRYGAIGISAVAAAVRYQGESKADAGARDDDTRASANSAA
jgi:hypothetical protein